jgi:localization factor PodJL
MSASDPMSVRGPGAEGADAPQEGHPLERLARRLSQSRRDDPQAASALPEIEQLVTMLAARDLQTEDRLAKALEGLARWAEGEGTKAATLAEPAPKRGETDTEARMTAFARSLTDPQSERPRQPSERAPLSQAAPAQSQPVKVAPRAAPAAAPRAAAAPEPVSAASKLASAPMASLRAALAEIAARQKALDTDEETPAAARTSPAEDMDARASKPPLGVPRTQDAAQPASSGLAAAQELRGEIDRLGRAVAELPTRAEIDALTREMAELATRLGDERPARLDVESLRAIDALVGDVDRLRGDAASPQMIDRFSGELAAVAERLDALGPSSAAALDALARRVEEVREELDHLPRSAAIEGVALEIQSVISRLDAHERAAAPAIEAVGTLSGRVESLDGRLTEMAESTRSRGDEFDRISETFRAELGALPRAEDVSDLGRKLDEIADGLAAQGVATASGGLIEKVERVDGKLDAVLAATETRGADAERLAEAMRAEIAAASPTRRLDDLGRQIEALTLSLASRSAPAADPEAVGLIADKIDGLGERMDEVAASTRARGAAFDRVEEAVRAIAEELIRARPQGGLGAGGADAAAALEQQMAMLAETMERSGGRIDDLNAGFAALAARIEQSSAAASRSVIEAVRGELAGGAPAAAAPDVGDLAQALSELRASASKTERRTAETLEAVRATLEALVDRLEETGRQPIAPEPAIDHSLSRLHAEPAPQPVPARSPAPAPAPAPDPTEAARAAARRALAEAGPSEPMRFEFAAPATAAFQPIMDLAPDHPIEPGTSGQIRPDANAPSIAAQSAASFIAAARRAQAQPFSEEEFEPAPEEAPRGSRFASSLAALKARKRPLLLGFGATLVVLAILYVASGMTGGEPELAPEPPTPTESGAAPAQRDSAADAPVRSVAVSTERPVEEEIAREERAAPPPADAPEPATASPEPQASAAPEASPAVASLAAAAPQDAPLGSLRDLSRETPTGSISRNDSLPEAIGSRILRTKALAGDPAAQLEVGDRLAAGRGVAADPAAAARWLEKAATQGLAPAQHRLGSMYEKGRGVTRDVSAARRWYEQAAASGNVRAMHNLGVLHAEGALGKPDLTAAAVWFRMAAERGLVDSQYNLGVLMARGAGAKRDLAEAYKWFALANAQGDSDAGQKRDEVGKALGPRLAAAKAAAESFRARPTDPAANEVAPPPGGWDHVAAKSPGKVATPR